MSPSRAPVSVLLVDDDEEDARIAVRLLERVAPGRYVLEHRTTGAAALAALRTGTFDVLVLDYRLGAETGLDMLREARAAGVDLPTILLTGRSDRAVDLAAMQAGVVDFLEKRRLDGSSLERAIRYAAERRRTERERIELLARERAAQAEAQAAHGRTTSLSAELEAERTLFREVLQQLPIGVVVAEVPGGRLLSGNGELERIWRHPFLPSRGVEHYGEWRGVHEDGRPYAAADWPLARTLRTGEPVTGHEVAILRGDDSRATVLINSTLIRGADTAPIAAVVTLEDVTARKEMEAALREREEALRAREARFRTLIEHASDPIVILDAAGMITYASPAVERVVGCLPEEVAGARAAEFVHEEDAPHALAALRRVASGPSEVAHIGFRLRHRDGSWRTVRSTSRNLLDDPTVGGIVVNLHDVSTETRLAEQLRQSQKLEAVGQLAGGIAHDFNNILTVIRLHGEALADTLDDGDPRRAELDEVREAARRATGLTRQLLAFSRKQLLQPRVLDLDDVVESVAPMLRRVIGEDVEMATRAGGGALRVLADPGQLEQVLMNLVINARDAMPGGGAVTVETQRVELDESYAERHETVTPGSYALLAVSDTGEGMDQATRERLFEPFFTTKAPGKGTGLGLATVYGIVRQSGGHIWVYSERGHGTTFKIYLPLAAGDAAVAEDPPPAPPPVGSETILLVEDEDAVRALTRRLLVRQGYRVIEARHGVDALAVAASHGERIDLLITDVVMPQMNGRELAERLREARPGIRVLYMSGYTSDDILRRRALDPRSQRILEKPFTAGSLAEAARAALDADLAA